MDNSITISADDAEYIAIRIQSLMTGYAVSNDYICCFCYASGDEDDEKDIVHDLDCAGERILRILNGETNG